jgi:hypothetical protein
MRELGLLQRVFIAAATLLVVAVLFVYVTFDPSNRYRILAEPVMLRSVLLPGALLIGALTAWAAFVTEMRSGTWDGWLLFPRSRLALISSKVSVGLAGGVLVLLVPVATLWSVMRAFGNLGGPLIDWNELLLRSAFTQSALVLATTYLALGNAAVLAQEGRVSALAPLLLPLVATWRYFVGDGGLPRVSPDYVNVAWLIAVGLMLILLVISVSRHGERVSPLQTSLRAVLIAPCAAIMLMIVGLLGFDVARRLLREGEEVPFVSEVSHPDVGEDGTISTENEGLSMYSLRTPDEWEEPAGDRLRKPLHNLGNLQLFRHPDRSLILAFDQSTGADLGCIGVEGLVACAQATPFDSAPSVLWLNDAAAIVTATMIYGLEDEGTVSRLWTGSAVRRAVEMGELLALVGDDDLLAVRPGKEAGTLAVEVTCAGAASAGRDLERVAIVDHPIAHDTSEGAAPPKPFVAARAAFFDDPQHEEILVCRDGGIVEHVLVPKSAPQVEPRFGRGDAQAVLVGPVVDRLVTTLRSDRVGEAWPLRTWAAVGFAMMVTVLAGLFVGIRRRTFPWWVLLGPALGPSYVLAGLVLAWRRPRWLQLVGGNS